MTCSVAMLIEQACANGFVAAAADAVTSQALWLQLLCDISQD